MIFFTIINIWKNILNKKKIKQQNIILLLKRNAYTKANKLITNTEI